MKQDFGTLPDGRKASLYTIENENVILKVSDYGAALVSLIDKKTGLDVHQGYDSVQGYLDYCPAHIGVCIGRTANRIGKGTFILNGETYHLVCNNNGNSLHSNDCFNTKIWAALESENEIVFRYTSPDGDAGFPGVLYVKVTYHLLPHGISISCDGTADKDTLLAFTQHSYFNLDQSNDALHHQLQINASQYAPTDADGLTLDQLDDVAGTPFDFRHFKEVGKEIHADNEQLRFGNGYDHYFAIPGKGMRDMCTAKGEKLLLTMRSDYPGMHLYTSNFLNGEKGKYGMKYAARSALCFEAEYMPNAINYEDVEEKPIVHAGETMHHEIEYIFKSL